MKNRIENKLKSSLNPSYLEVIDDSAAHMGHAGNSLSGESHFIIRISAPNLNGAPKVDAHRMIYKALEEELNQIHALNIEIL